MLNLRIFAFISALFTHSYGAAQFSCPSWFGVFEDTNDITGGGFYLCAMGYSIHGSCNDSMLFYPQKCVGWRPPIASPVKSFQCPWIDANYPDISDSTCKGYWSCFAQNATYATCQSNENFDTINGVCSQDATCDGYARKCDEQFSYTADADDKNKYWECYYGIPYHWSCDPGLEFDAEKHYCDTPAPVKAPPTI